MALKCISMYEDLIYINLQSAILRDITSAYIDSNLLFTCSPKDNNEFTIVRESIRRKMEAS